MQLNTAKNELQTNSEFSSQEFSIGDVSVIIDILRNRLYKFKIRTLVQEYISNGRDAQREINSTTPIEINAPSKLDPVFKVRDYGPGISEERMAKVFTQYGASTKRSTNSQTGGFGIGAKSAWSYTDSFSVVTIHNGKKRSYVAHIGESKQGRLDHIETIDTLEPSGTEIQIAIKPQDAEEFRNSIARAVYFWKPEEQPKIHGMIHTFNDPGERIGPLERSLGKTFERFVDWNFSYSSSEHDPIAVIDGIIYPLTELKDKSPELKQLSEIVGSKVILHIENGALEVSASRESITDTDLSIRELSRICRQAISSLTDYISIEFDKATSLLEWINIYENIKKDFKLNKEIASYDGFYIGVDENDRYGYDPTEYLFHPTLFKKVHLYKKHYYGSYRRKTQTLKTEELKPKDCIRLDLIKHLFWKIQDDRLDGKKIAQYLWNRDYCVVVRPIMEKGYIHDVKKLINYLGVKKLSSLPYVPEPATVRARAAQRDRSKLRVYTYTRLYHNKEAQDLDLEENTKKYIYICTDDKHKYKSFEDLAHWMNRATKYTLCTMSKTNIPKIQDNELFITLEKFLETFKIESEHLAYYKHEVSKYKTLILLLKDFTSKLKDPFIIDMVNEYDFKNNNMERLPEMLKDRLCKEEVLKFERKDIAFGKLFKRKYPSIWYFHYKSSSNGNHRKFINEVLK